MEIEEVEKKVEIEMDEDATEVYACLKDTSELFEKKDFVKFLSNSNIDEGVIYDNIDKMLEEKMINRRYKVAECKKPIHGQDGWFEFLFETNIDTKPKILADGSVDYSEYGNVPSVDEGQQVAIYHPATPSEDGINFRGETLVAVKGKELAKLKGTGFFVSENGREYFAKTSGKVTYENERLVIENELVIEGDVSHVTGDIEFINDIHVRGNVLTGVKLHSAKGSIIIDGYVEACELYSAKDVVLKNGMQGNGKGRIIAGGNVSGKFFEQVTIEAKGDVNANAIMNSYVTATQDIIVSGKFGIIIGGVLRAEREISATIIGNMSEVKTQLYAGLEENPMGNLIKVEKEITGLHEELQKIHNGIIQIEELIEKLQRDDLANKKIQLIRVKVLKENELTNKEKEKQEIMEQITRVSQAKVTVLKALYPGTTVNINGMQTQITEDVSCVQLMTKGAAIQMFSMV